MLLSCLTTLLCVKRGKNTEYNQSLFRCLFEDPNYYMKSLAEQYQEDLREGGFDLINFGLTWNNETAIDHARGGAGREILCGNCSYKICGQIVLTAIIPKCWYGKCHTGHTAGALTDWEQVLNGKLCRNGGSPRFFYHEWILISFSI